MIALHHGAILQVFAVSCLLVSSDPGLPDYTVSTNRLDSIDVTLRDNYLELRVYCSGGIGRTMIEFSQPLFMDSLFLELYYDSKRVYGVCECLTIQVRQPGGESETLSRGGWYPPSEGAAIEVAQGDVTGPSQRGDIDNALRPELKRVTQSISQNQTALGVGVDNLNGLTAQGGNHVTRL